MITYFHVPLMILNGCLLLSMWRFWACINRMGFMREVGQRAPTLLGRDIVAAIFAFMPVVLAATDWLHSPTSSIGATFLSVLCIAASVFILNQSGERFSPRWAGSRESALRTVAALRIIDAADLAYALQYVQERETANAGRVIDVETLREVRK